ncbi:DUF3137 domain-containing protein [Cellulomonas xylanilytica]|uniref:DUF3137 domain-containing protein n=1 Tax=Cellulomonas xylanilytica TaxID=233583 RepID=A0A510V066_9CELL|nr:DUF3137 domain-containing protein [Cellulomonas xylanilytica]GEK20307.1 hypothetical protein CXY01_08270 [Cellulomonas xylanilytica]
MGDVSFGLLVVLGGVVMLGLAVAGFWVQKKRHERFRGWALRNGWTYAQSERSLVDLSRGQPFGQGSSRRAIEVLRGTYDSRPALSFTYVWTTGSGKNKSTHHAHVVALALPTYLPTVEVTPEGLGARLAKLVGAQDVQLESDAFNRAYRVAARDQRTGHAILHPRLMERLLRPDALGTAWRIDGTWILSWASGTTDLDRLASRLGLLSAVARSVPRHVWLDHGHDPLAPAGNVDPDATIV